MISKMTTVGLAASVAAVATLSAAPALAGGFAVREQSALGQGSSFAGVGASKALSAMFFNSAAVTSLSGTNSDANFSAIIPDAQLTATSGGTNFAATTVRSAEIGVDAIVPASYFSHQFKADPRLFIGLGLNSGFGLKTEPDVRWAGSQIASSTRLFTINFNPTLGYKLSDQLSVGVGAQFEYAKAVFKFATAAPTGPHSFFEGDNMAVGATAGLMYTPTPATRIGLGWRSQITHELEGRFGTSEGAPLPAVASSGGAFSGVTAKADLRLPDIVTLSINQAVSPNIRALGTVEWSNWSRLGNLDVIATGTGRTFLNGPVAFGQKLGSIDTTWQDGWFFSGGLEYDYSDKLTLRTGIAYEISPVQKATDRVISIPDANRLWASLGFTYNMSAATSIDFGYSHIFAEDSKFDRRGLAPGTSLQGDLEASADIISLGVRMKLGE
jgi:long-chain fatty acid transport protein